MTFTLPRGKLFTVSTEKIIKRLKSLKRQSALSVLADYVKAFGPEIALHSGLLKETAKKPDSRIQVDNKTKAKIEKYANQKKLTQGAYIQWLQDKYEESINEHRKQTRNRK